MIDNNYAYIIYQYIIYAIFNLYFYLRFIRCFKYSSLRRQNILTKNQFRLYLNICLVFNAPDYQISYRNLICRDFYNLNILSYIN